MKTDPIFYRLFKEIPSSFFELIGYSGEEANRYRFDSCELKQTAFRIDGLFVPVEENSPQPLYFVEVQFRNDAKIYANLFAEIFIYLNQNNPAQDWRAVVIYGTRRFEPDQLTPYQELLNSQKVSRVYLDEFPEQTSSSIGIGIIQFVVSDEETSPDKGRQLLQQSQEINDEATRIDVINLIETVIVYKFPQKSRKELERMFGLDDLKKTKFAQEIREETKLEVVPALLERGFTIEEIAQILKLEVEQVRQAVEKAHTTNS